MTESTLQFGAGHPHKLDFYSPTEPGRQGCYIFDNTFQRNGSQFLEKDNPGDNTGEMLLSMKKTVTTNHINSVMLDIKPKYRYQSHSYTLRMKNLKRK